MVRRLVACALCALMSDHAGLMLVHGLSSVCRSSHQAWHRAGRTHVTIAALVVLPGARQVCSFLGEVWLNRPSI